MAIDAWRREGITETEHKLYSRCRYPYAAIGGIRSIADVVDARTGPARSCE